MIRRLSLIAALAALGAALALPLPAAAAYPWSATVKVDHCQYTGGNHNRGYMELKVKAREIGRSGTTRFVIHSERQESSGLAFSTVSTYPVDKSLVFPNNGTSYYHVVDRRYDFTRNDELTQRFVFTIKFKGANGHTLTSITVNGSPC